LVHWAPIKTTRKAVWHRLNLEALRNQIPPSNKRKLASIPNDLD